MKTMTKKQAKQALEINKNGQYSSFYESYQEYCYEYCKDMGLLVNDEIPDNEWAAGLKVYEEMWIDNYMDMTVADCEELNRERLQKERDDEKKATEARRWAALTPKEKEIEKAFRRMVERETVKLLKVFRSGEKYNYA